MKIRRAHVSFLLLVLLLSSLSSLNHSFSSRAATPMDLSGLSYKQEVTISLDTSLEMAARQPIDMQVSFDQSCWAQDETHHSVRVGYDDGSGLTEIESQIYGLQHSDENHITSCNVVFLIPEEATGKESYYVLYDSSETDGPDYVDHLSYEDTHYFFEPISGQRIDFDYYKIIEDGYIVYGLLQKGEILANGVSNCIARLKPDETIFETTTMDQLAPVYMSYSIDGPVEYAGTAWATSVTKSVLVDGNLMLRIRIEGDSPDGIIHTDNIYTYYYTPQLTKRIYVDVLHEVLQPVEITGDQERDPTYASLTTFKARSATIEKMNIGDILPMLDFPAEDGTIKEYAIPEDPNTEKAEWILSYQDDADVGTDAWISMGDPATGKAHGFIFDSVTGLVEGKDDGIELKVSTKQHVKLPGLEADTGDLFVARNSYEQGSHDTSIAQDTTVRFNMEFVTFQNGGYDAVAQEANLYHQLIPQRPSVRDNATTNNGGNEEKEKYTLTTYVHLAPTFPLGAMLSAVTGKNISYLNAELYKAGSFSSSGSPGRLGLANMDLDLEGKNLGEKIKTVLGLFDWKNASLFKKIRFPDLDEGCYLVKIFRENPLLGNERQYIGFAIVNLTEDTATHIYCRPEGKLKATLVDQGDDGVENARVVLMRDDVVIAEETTDAEGEVMVKAPCFPAKPYTLQILYKGFLVEEETVSLGLRNRVRPSQHSYEMSLYTLDLQVKDALELPPAVEVSPILTSSNMVDVMSLTGEEQSAGNYRFSDMIPAEYLLKMSYKSVILEESVRINKDTTLKLEFPAEFPLTLHFLNAVGMSLSSQDMTLSREGRQVNTQLDDHGTGTIDMPPGTYEVTVLSGTDILAQQLIDVKGEKELTIVTTEGSLIHSIVMVLGGIVAGFAVVYMIWKRDLRTGLQVLALGLLIIALMSPWWVLSGDNGTTSTATQTLLVPSHIVTLTTSPSVTSGEISFAPEELGTVLGLLAILVVVSCLLIVVGLFLRLKFKRLSRIIQGAVFLFIVLSVVLFFVAMSQVTDVGVGSFSGGGDLEITLPGLQETTVLDCGWGPGIGFYLSIVAAVLLSGVTLVHLVRRLGRKLTGS
jgi:hypothetical protein